MTIRRVRNQDDFVAAAVLLGEQRAWVEAVTGADLAAVQADSVAEYTAPHRHYAPPVGGLVLALDGERPVGIVGVRLLGPGRGELKRMYVRHHARGTGAGRALLDEALALAADLGCTVVGLETDRDAMDTAHRLYGRRGFREVTPATRWGRDSVVLMELDLRARRAA
jgi:GNAT superfamily N-acetyltransferase